eukprot:scaffold26027_cov70-Attheya_sp.AAC.15
MEQGTIAKWNKKEGESFIAGDTLCEVETDKATMDFEAQDDGVIAKILADAGPNDIACGEPIMITVEEASDVDAFKDYVVAPTSMASSVPPEAPPAPAAPPSAPTPAPISAPAPAAAPVSGSTTIGRIIASPKAHMLASAKGISLLKIIGTGPGGRIIAADVDEYVPVAEVAAAPAAVEASAAAPAVAAVAAPVAPPTIGEGYTDYPLSEAAKGIAAQLTHSKQNVPHYYLTVDLALDELLKMRATLNQSLKLGEDDAGISVNDLLVKAAASAMKAVPSANASWMDSVVRVYDSVDINVVVGSGDALYAPIVRNAGGRGVKAISDDVAAAVASLEEEATGPEFHSVGTFTMMNLGMYGIKSCAPIIREPQACALALGAIENRIVPNDDVESEEIYKQSVMLTATLSCDHRVVDGAVGAQWLSAFKSGVENPTTLLL